MSILCKLIGHKWYKKVIIGQHLEEKVAFTGYGLTGLGGTGEYYSVNDTELVPVKTCLRCGKPNPNTDILIKN